MRDCEAALVVNDGLLEAVDALDDRMGRFIRLWFRQLQRVLNPSVLHLVLFWRLQANKSVGIAKCSVRLEALDEREAELQRCDLNRIRFKSVQACRDDSSPGGRAGADGQSAEANW